MELLDERSGQLVVSGCAGSIKDRNEKLYDLIITVWIDIKQNKFPITLLYSTTVRFKK